MTDKSILVCPKCSWDAWTIHYQNNGTGRDYYDMTPFQEWFMCTCITCGYTIKYNRHEISYNRLTAHIMLTSEVCCGSCGQRKPKCEGC